MLDDLRRQASKELEKKLSVSPNEPEMNLKRGSLSKKNPRSVPAGPEGPSMLSDPALSLSQEEIKALLQENKKLSIANQELSCLFNLAPIAYFTVNAKGEITRANLVAAELVSKTQATVIGSSFLDHLHSEDQAIFASHLKRILKDQKNKKCEIRLSSHFHSGLHVSLETSYFPFGLDGTPEIKIAAIDISARKEAEDLFKGLLESAPDGVMVFDRHGTIITINQQTEKLFGYSREEIVGYTATDYLLSDDLAPRAKKEFTDLIDALLKRDQKENVLRWTCLALKKDQTSFLMEMSLSVFQFSRNLLICATVRDISEEKKREDELKLSKTRAEDSSREKSEFLANMSHEIRTPITAILGYTEILDFPNAADSRDEQAEFIRKIRSNAYHLLSLINDILDIAKVESGMLKIERASFPLASEITNVFSMLEGRSKEKGLHLTLECDGPVPQMISSDSTRIRQILLNLVSNAIKFTEKGVIKLSVRYDQSPNGQRLEFRVSDTGCGIKKEDCDKIFDPFIQADAANNRRYGGTGLGLALSKRLGKHLGGDVILEKTSVGQGSTFLATIDPGHVQAPFIRTFESPHPPLDSSFALKKTAAQRQILKGVRILLADDGDDNRLLFSTVLNKAGASVDVAENGREAVEKASHRPYDVILMDIQMPEMDGLEATQILRESGHRIPILALSAHALAEHQEKSIRLGCNEHIAKPVSARDLVQKVAQWLEKGVDTSDDKQMASHLSASEVPSLNPLHETPLYSQFSGDTLISQLLPVFSNRLPARLENMIQAFGNQNWEEVLRAAHQLKGTAGSFGYDILSVKMVELEEEIKKPIPCKTRISNILNHSRNISYRIQLGLRNSLQ
jgi:PAS domain S-box-containing protein